MLMEALFGKLCAYELELIQQSHAEEREKKRKGIPLKLILQRKTKKKALVMTKMHII